MTKLPIVLYETKCAHAQMLYYFKNETQSLVDIT